MKNIMPNLVELFKMGYCTPQIARIARKLGEPSTTIHYNVKKMENEGVVKAYKAVFDYSKIGAGLCNFVLISLSPDEYGDPEKIAKQLAKHPSIESVDICTGDWEMILKVRARDMDEYYDLVRNVISVKGVTKMKTLTTLKQIKTEFVQI